MMRRYFKFPVFNTLSKMEKWGGLCLLVSVVAEKKYWHVTLSVKRLLVFLFVHILFLTLSSCSAPSMRESIVDREYSRIVDQQYQRNDPHLNSIENEISKALVKGASSASDMSSVPSSREKRFNVSVNKLPAKTFFLSLVSDSGINVVAHPEVDGNISLELRSVTVGEVLDVARDVYGYEFKYENGIYTIFPRKLRTEIFPINYLDIQRVGVTDTSVLIGRIESTNDTSSSSSSSSQEDGANLLGYLEADVGSEDGGDSISPGVQVQTLNKTDFWHGLHATLLAIIGDKEDGRMVMTNPQAGLVVVKALPRELHSVRAFLEKSELSVKRQVILETKILEVRLDEGFESGINWGAISGELALSQTLTGSGTISDVILSSEGASDVLFSSALNIVDITKLLKLLEKQGSVQVLSSPRISTVNNQKALIRVGSDEFFVTGVSNSTTSNAAAVTSTPDIELGSFFSGIALDVTPQIAESGDVILHVHPIVSDVKDQLKDVVVGDNSFSLPLALRDVRETDSIVRARSGQIVVLGGLMQEVSSDASTKRPLLGNIPIVNWFFKTKEKSSSKTELVILMRPIVVNEDTWEREIIQGQQRFKELTSMKVKE